MNHIYTEQMMRDDSERSMAARRSRRHIIITAEYNSMMSERATRAISIAVAVIGFTPLLVVSSTKLYA